MVAEIWNPSYKANKAFIFGRGSWEHFWDVKGVCEIWKAEGARRYLLRRKYLVTGWCSIPLRLWTTLSTVYSKHLSHAFRAESGEVWPCFGFAVVYGSLLNQTSWTFLALNSANALCCLEWAVCTKKTKKGVGVYEERSSLCPCRAPLQLAILAQLCVNALEVGWIWSPIPPAHIPGDIELFDTHNKRSSSYTKVCPGFKTWPLLKCYGLNFALLTNWQFYFGKALKSPDSASWWVQQMMDKKRAGCSQKVFLFICNGIAFVCCSSLWRWVFLAGRGIGVRNASLKHPQLRAESGTVQPSFLDLQPVWVVVEPN